jgi:hypothetical protein
MPDWPWPDPVSDLFHKVHPQEDFSKDLFLRGIYLLDRLLEHEGRPWEQFRVPRISGFIDPAGGILKSDSRKG